MIPENWHFNSCFVLKTTKTAVVVFITEILWQTFWSNKWRSVFDAVKDYSFCRVWFISQWASRLFMLLSKFASLFKKISSCPKSVINKHKPRFSWCCSFQWNLLLPTYGQRYSCKYICTHVFLIRTTLYSSMYVWL